MQLFIPYASPIETAKCLDPTRLQDLIENCGKAVAAIKEGRTPKGLEGVDAEWLDRYRVSLAYYAREDIALATWWSGHTDNVRPAAVTEDFCKKSQRALYAKYPKKYPQFAEV